MKKELIYSKSEIISSLYKTIGYSVDLYELIKYLKGLEMKIHTISFDPKTNVLDCVEKSCQLQQVYTSDLHVTFK